MVSTTAAPEGSSGLASMATARALPLRAAASIAALRVAEEPLCISRVFLLSNDSTAGGDDAAFELAVDGVGEGPRADVPAGEGFTKSLDPPVFSRRVKESVRRNLADSPTIVVITVSLGFVA